MKETHVCQRLKVKNMQSIQEMIENGFSTRRVAKILKMEDKDVREIVKNNNYKMLIGPFTDDKIQVIIDLYKAGVSAKNLAIKYSIDRKRVVKWLTKEGCLRSAEDAKRFTYFNQNVFDEIDTQDKAYWLGFLYADAYNCQLTNTFSLTLAVKDFDHIIKFAKFCSYPENEVFKGNVGKDEETYPTANIKLYSKYFCEKLAKLGCPQGKSLILTFPDWMKEELKIHFIRGYFDGDGSIKVYEKTKEWRLNFCGTKENLTGMIDIFKSHDINTSLSYHSDSGNNTWVFNISGNQQVLRACNLLYNDANTYMDRKYDRYKKLELQQANRKITSIRDTYFIPEDIKEAVRTSALSIDSIAEEFNICTASVKRIKNI